MEECIFTDSSKLDQLRNEIKEIDKQLVELISKRLRVAKQIGQIKSVQGLPIRNFQVEKKVFERVSQLSEKLSVPQELSNDVFEKIVANSVAIQENLPMKIQKETEQKKILILGGKGRMGQWLTHYFSSSGHCVKSVDPSYPETEDNYQCLPSDLNQFDVIAISTPLHRIADDIAEVMERNPSGLIFDIASLKSEILKVLTDHPEFRNLQYVSVHPMFGPSAVNLHGKNLVVCKVFSETPVEKFIRFFEDTAVNIQIIDISEHDKLMGYSLNLVHLINIILADLLTSNEYSFSYLKKFSSTTFEKQIQTTYEVAHENPELYWAIQHFNSYRDKLFEELQKSISKVHDASRTQTPFDFMTILANSRAYFKS